MSVGQSRHLFSTEASPLWTYGPTMLAPSHNSNRNWFNLCQSDFSLLFFWPNDSISGFNVLYCATYKNAWTSPWSRGAMFKWRIANDSDMSALAMSSLALFSCTRHLRCCIHVPPPNGIYCGRYLPGRADRGLGAARVVRNRPYIWPKPCLPWAQTSTRGQG